MLTSLLISLACFGNADTVKVVNKNIEIKIETQHCKQIKAVKKEFKDTIGLLKLKQAKKKAEQKETAKKEN